MKTFTKNPSKWNKDEILNELDVFKNLYKDRPVKENIHGMRFQHMFATYLSNCWQRGANRVFSLAIPLEVNAPRSIPPSSSESESSGLSALYCNH